MAAPYSRALQIRALVKARLQALMGTGGSLLPEAGYAIATSSFYERTQPWSTGVTFPACLLNFTPERLKDGTNVGDDIGHGIKVTFAVATNRALTTADEDKVIWWRQVAIEEFNNRRLVGMTEVFCKVEIGEVWDPTANVAMFAATSFVIRAEKRYTRTQG